MATKVTSSLINTVSASQITATGATAGQVLTYNGSTSTWEASAAPGGNALVSLSGYQVFPSGIIMQWGRVNDDATTKNFPIAFPNACASFVATAQADQYATNPYATQAFIVSNSQFRLRQGDSVTNGLTLQWMAIGY